MRRRHDFSDYLVQVAGGKGQSRQRQIDCLAELGAALGNQQGMLWRMQNGYVMCNADGLASVDRKLAAASAEELDTWRQLLRIGIQRDVEVTEPDAQAQVVTQAYCSALPVAYSGFRPQLWRRFAKLVLEAAYEATLLAGVLNFHESGSPVVLLTRLGGGALATIRTGYTRQ